MELLRIDMLLQATAKPRVREAACSENDDCWGRGSLPQSTHLFISEWRPARSANSLGRVLKMAAAGCRGSLHSVP